MASVVSVHRRRLHVTDFSNTVLFRCSRWAARALILSPMKASGPPSLAQLFATRASPWAMRTPARVPGRPFWWDVLTQHDHPVVHMAETARRATEEAQASLLLRLLPHCEHFNNLRESPNALLGVADRGVHVSKSFFKVCPLHVNPFCHCLRCPSSPEDLLNPSRAIPAPSPSFSASSVFANPRLKV